MEKNIKIEFLSRWGIFKIAEYRYIINRKYGTAYQKTMTSKSIINENESYYWSESYLEDAFNCNEIFFDKHGNIIEVPAEVLKNL